MSCYKDIINSYKEINISSKELFEAISKFHHALDYVEEHEPKVFWKSMRKFHEKVYGHHFNEAYAKYQVKEMYHTKSDGIKCKGQIYSIEEVKPIYERYVHTIKGSYNCWDFYVALNAQYHDYVNLYKGWKSDITAKELNEKIIVSAINFWFNDEDAEDGKVWNYFKDI